LSSATAFRQGIYQFDWVRRVARWLDAMPNAALAIEVAPDRVAAARWSAPVRSMAIPSNLCRLERWLIGRRSQHRERRRR